VLTACKNREKNLNMSRKNIVNIDNVIEHLIIDWSSNKTIQLENTKNSRVIVKDNEKYYRASRAYNFGVNFVQTDYVLKLDTDTLIDPDKFNK
jgi:cellulose synthase/poly-beta-1,6-N-acetylglucosamine synthase-like glycosyltransferase